MADILRAQVVSDECANEQRLSGFRRAPHAHPPTQQPAAHHLLSRERYGLCSPGLLKRGAPPPQSLRSRRSVRRERGFRNYAHQDRRIHGTDTETDEPEELNLPI